jgi:hypothetical protein
MVVKHLSPASLPANQVHTGTGIDFTLSSYSSVSFRYQAIDNLWHIISSHNDFSGGGTSYWSASGANIFNNNAGNVGIGTTTPVHGRLEITGRVGATVAMFGSDAYGIGISSNNPEIGFNYFFNGTTYTMKAGYGANLGMDPSNGNVYLGNFGGNQSATDFGPISGYQNVLTVTQSGRLGIKNASPGTELDITGQGRITGSVLSSPGLFGNLTSGGGFFLRNNADRKAMYFDGTKIQTQEFNLSSSGSFAIPLLVNPFGGNVGIGTLDPGTYKLAVNGNIHSKEVVVESGWADYVFENNYPLTALPELEKFILEHRHLPNIPSTSDIEKNGLQLGDIQKRMMEKIEELTLYIIEQNKKIDKLEKLAVIK